ncbi:MAG TPA: hypothetical protein PK264_20435 [Hyphomicrobiaceae bacterium]|nr:hypothetical protein [Hyphomicrobiaceae bacterium]
MSFERDRFPHPASFAPPDHAPTTQPLLSRLKRVDVRQPNLGDALEAQRIDSVIRDLTQVLGPNPAAGAATWIGQPVRPVPVDPQALGAEIERMIPNDGPYPAPGELPPLPVMPSPPDAFADYSFVEADEERMPIPSTWRETSETPAEPWLSRQLASGLVGLGVGLAVILPLTLWVLGSIGGPGAGPTAATTSDPIVVAVRPQPVVAPARAVAASAADVAIASEPIPVITTPAGDPTVLLASVELLVTGGEIGMARSLLLQSELRTHPAVIFALAETFDPNMLAAWSVTGVNAEPAKARELYTKALDGGVDRARARIDALQ